MRTARSEDPVLYQVNPPTVLPTAAEDDIIEQALQIMANRLGQEPSQVMSRPEDVKRYCTMRLGLKDHEVFMVLYLDSRHRLITAREEFRGSLTSTSVYPREIIKSALNLSAAAVILCHNHPSGSLEPSQADKALTRTLKQGLACIDVEVLDHIIVGRTNALSFAESGAWI